VVRADRADAAHFATVFAEAARRLEPLSSQDKMRWQQLLRLVLYWGIYRRPSAEQPNLIETARSSQTSVALQQEVQTMTQQLGKTWEQEIWERGIAQGELKGKLQLCRDLLQNLLQKRFPAVPDELIQRIQATTDLPRLQACVQQAVDMTSLDDLQL